MRVPGGDMRCAIAMVIATLVLLAPASADPTPLGEPASVESVQRWMSNYRAKPDPATVPAVVRALSRLGAFKDPEASETHVGFIAGVIGANPGKAEELIAKMLPLPDEDQWIIVRAIAYSGLPEWKALLAKFAERMPARKVMIDKILANKLPTLWQMAPDQRPSAWATVKDYLTIDRLTGKEKRKDVVLDPTAELLDTFWGYYFATGSARPISRIVAMLPWSKEDDSVEKL